jgi:DNA-binding CsgD family transcriptional regulator
VYDGLVEKIYEAATVPQIWPAVLGDVAALGDGGGGLLIIAPGQADRETWSGWTASHAIADMIDEYVAAGWPARTDRWRRVVAAQRRNFIDDLHIYTPQELETEPVFADFLRPRGWGRRAATAAPGASGDALLFAVEREYARGPANASVLQRLDGLRPHLARAGLLSARLRLECAQSAAQALALVGLPGAVLGANGKAVAANASFEELIPATVQDRTRRLTLTDAAADALFGDALAALRTRRHSRGARSIPIRADHEAPPMIAHVIPICGEGNDVFARAAALLVFTAVRPQAAPNAAVLQGLFDFSPAEARVARGIAERHTVDEIAQTLGVSRETVRTQLKAVLAKTGASRQLDLGVLLAGAGLTEL